MTNILHTGPLRAHLFEQIAEELPKMADNGLVTPKLVVILVGDDPASQVYVRNKKITAEKLGIKGEICRLEKDATQEELHEAIDRYNNDAETTAILVQMPLPKHLDEFEALSRISALKDVDGLTTTNAGLLELGRKQNLLVPATPLGIIRFLKWANVEMEGKEAIVLGRSILVGMPVSRLLTNENATVTVCHSRTRDLDAHLKRADIVVAAIGKANFVNGSQLKKGAAIVDVGINSVDAPDTEKGYKLVGDVDTASCEGVASVITPVPGGVGPMTVASLMTNVIDAAYLQAGMDAPKWDANAPMDVAA